MDKDNINKIDPVEKTGQGGSFLERELNGEEKKAIYEKLAEKAVASLLRRGIDAQYVPSRAEALTAVLSMIPENTIVGCNDSQTLLQVGILSALRQRGRNETRNPFRRNAEGHLRMTDKEEILDLMRSIFQADIYLIGTNAITLDGRLVNVDGLGNRVAAMIFGPKKVIILAGINKIVKTLEDALKRVRECAPINAYRHLLKHHMEEYSDLPCIKTGYCVDCNHPMRVCNFTVIIEGQNRRVTKGESRMNVVIVGEPLGI